MDIKTQLINYIAKVSNTPVNEIAADTKLYDSAVISSLQLLDLMTYLENEYSIQIEPYELRDDTFKDINTLSQFIASKKN